MFLNQKKRETRMIKQTIVNDIIGKTFADKLEEVIFPVSPSFNYTRREMVENIGCANFIAAQNLAKVLKRLGIKSAQELYKIGPHSLLRSKGIGETSLFVAMCILYSEGFSVLKWWGWTKEHTKFAAYRHQIIKKSRNRKQEI